MPPPILTLRDISLSFGGTPLLEGAELMVSRGERLCLVGRNGSGKTTLLKIAAGLIEFDSGERFVQPGTTIRYLTQEPDLSGYRSTLDYVEDGLATGDDPYRARQLLELLGLDGSEDPARLSGGEARRSALARALAPKPDILLLDEPTNHLDLPAIQWLEEELGNLASALVLISHDRRFLENLSRATVWLDRGRLRRLGKGFADFEAWRDETLEQEQLDRHKLARKIHRENHWLIHGVSARRKRNQRRLGALHAMRLQRRQLRQVTGAVKMTQTVGGQSGKLVAEAEDIGKSFGGPAIVDGFSARIQRGDRIGLMGPNGAGKTTLLNMLTGLSQPDRGTVRLGASVQMVSIEQSRESLDPNWTLTDALTGGGGDHVSVGGQTKHVIGYMKDFLFSPEQAGTPIGELSGGERGRLMLARALAMPSNLLVLDEPTNDLDLETLDLLQELLADYQGTVLLVSHDRDFIDRVVTSVIASEGPGRWVEYAGGYSDMTAQKAGAPRDQNRDVNTAAKAKAVDKAAPASASGSQPAAKTRGKTKLSYKQTYALKSLPGEMARLEGVIEAHRGTLADTGLYVRDADAFTKAADALAAAESDLAVMEEEWLALEIEREAIEGGGG
jgi:ATP-binding cassette subfamily F protein uup